MGWDYRGDYFVNPGEIVANLPVVNLNEQFVVMFPDEQQDYVNVFGYMLLTGNEYKPEGRNCLLESVVVPYSPTLVKFTNQNLDGSFQFYRTRGHGDGVTVRLYQFDGALP